MNWDGCLKIKSETDRTVKHLFPQINIEGFSKTNVMQKDLLLYFDDDGITTSCNNACLKTIH